MRGGGGAQGRSGGKVVMTLETPAYYPYRDTEEDRRAVEKAYAWRLRWWVDREAGVIWGWWGGKTQNKYIICLLNVYQSLLNVYSMSIKRLFNVD